MRQSPLPGRREPMRRTQMSRRRIRPTRARGWRTAEDGPTDPTAQDRYAENGIRVTVYQRATPAAGGLARCELCGNPVRWEDYDCHHRKLRSRGGHDTPENRACLHHDCHHAGGRPDAVHRAVAQATILGLIVRSGFDPAKVPVTLPDGREVLFTTDGQYGEAT